ncbi:MAG: YHS domain-containing protein [Spirochaetales bacterium]|nr:YHS domain-containing protein [Spirochaetales bacterium]MCP5485147.1 YHS domain-containing protein [Spirochaetales bacterium]
MVLDPVCGMTVNRLLTRNVFSFGGQQYYFCSPECLQIFKDREVRQKT